MIGSIPRRVGFWLLLSILIVACDQQARFEELVPKDEAAFAERYLQQLARGDLDAVEAKLDPPIVSPEIRAELAALSESFPKTNPKNIKLVGSNTRVDDERWQAQFTFEYEYPGQWLLAGVAMHRDGADLLIDGVNVEHIVDSIENIHRFTLEGKTPVHYAVLLAAGAVVVFIIYSLVLCIRSPHTGRRWVWIIFILLGLGTVNLNWTTGVLDFAPIHVLLFGVGFQKLLYAAPLVQVALPVGALGYHIARFVSRNGDGAEPPKQ